MDGFQMGRVVCCTALSHHALSHHFGWGEQGFSGFAFAVDWAGGVSRCSCLVQVL